MTHSFHCSVHLSESIWTYQIKVIFFTYLFIKKKNIYWYWSLWGSLNEACFMERLSHLGQLSTTQSSPDLLAWCLLWCTLSAMKLYRKCLPFQIMSNHLNFPDKDSLLRIKPDEKSKWRDLGQRQWSEYIHQLIFFTFWMHFIGLTLTEFWTSACMLLPIKQYYFNTVDILVMLQLICSAPTNYTITPSARPKLQCFTFWDQCHQLRS